MIIHGDKSATFYQYLPVGFLGFVFLVVVFLFFNILACFQGREILRRESVLFL